MGTVQAEAGATVVLPIQVDQIAGLESVQLTVAYSTSLLTLTAVRQAGVTADFQYRADQRPPGTITIDVSRIEPVTGSGPSRLFELVFTVAKDAPEGAIPIDLQWAALNDTALTLNPAPQPGLDVTDGWIMVRKALLPMPQPAASTPPWPEALGLLAQRFGLAPMRTDSEPAVLMAAAPPAPAEKFIGERRQWVTAFVGNLGRAAAIDPNAGLRVSLPVAAKTAPALSLLV